MGPRYTDINQGGGGNCKIVASLASIAYNLVPVNPVVPRLGEQLPGLANVASGNAWILRRAMADFGDGTFGVKLGGSFYRVDGDLPSGMANPGPEGCIWAAIAEKAICLYAPRTPGVFQWQDLFSIGPESVFRGFGSQTATGRILNQEFANAQDMLVKLDAAYQACQHIVFTLASATVNGTHAYTFLNLVWSGPTITGVRFRNPWGTDGNANGYNDGIPNDGIVTLSAQQIWQDANGGRAYLASAIR